jgi:hypothetical protein
MKYDLRVIDGEPKFVSSVVKEVTRQVIIAYVCGDQGGRYSVYDYTATGEFLGSRHVDGGDLHDDIRNAALSAWPTGAVHDVINATVAWRDSNSGKMTPARPVSGIIPKTIPLNNII